MTAVNEAELIKQDIEAFLTRHESKELLRFVVVGSVDDGKSSLIGRLLYDSNNVYEDQLAAVKKASHQQGLEVDLSLLTDGLKAEREQGITIDVAYRYFTTEKRKFIIADTPGHVQYTRNMATGASTANVATILIDARLGVLQQSRRHAFIASLLGIPHLLVAVNKMDLREYSKDVFETIKKDFSEFASGLGFKDVTFIPISAVKGDNVVNNSTRTPWYTGGTFLEYLDTVPITQDLNLTDFRFPVQYVLRPNLDYRGFAGRIASGVVKTGDKVTVLPSRKQSTVTSIDTYGGPIDQAFTPMSVTLRLADEVDVSRGDMLVLSDNLPQSAQRFDATVVWLNERGLDPDKSYLIKHTSNTTRVDIRKVHSKLNLETLKQEPVERLELNDIGKLSLQCHKPLHFDPYLTNRVTGAFILIDSLSNNTVAAGMIQPRDANATDAADDVSRTKRSQISATERRERLGHTGAVIWLTGKPGAGKTDLAYALERRLFDLGKLAMVIDPADGVSPAPAAGEASDTVIEIAKRAATTGLIVITAFASPRAADRRAAAAVIGESRFVEVHVEGGSLPADSVAEAPLDPARKVAVDRAGAERAAADIVDALMARGLID